MIVGQTPAGLALLRGVEPLKETQEILEQRRRFGEDRAGIDQRIDRDAHLGIDDRRNRAIGD